MDGQSLTPDKTKFEQLKAIMPEAFSEGKIDWEKLKATLGGYFGSNCATYFGVVSAAYFGSNCAAISAA